ncbi:MAG: hypothetical protein HOW73_02640 [Polyangiaceae bacterium]|nr:hypothetical protein [Polyangiaceae bacterium]
MGTRMTAMVERDDEEASILADVSALLREHFALAAWGRVLVELVRDPRGELQVADVQVEEIMGDEREVDRAFGSPDARALAPVLGKAIEALCALEGIEVDAVHGGTFVRADRRGDAPSVAFLPGLVNVPSAAFDGRRDEVLGKLRQVSGALHERFGVDDDGEVVPDMTTGTYEIRRGGAVVARGRQTVLGSFSAPHRSWVWGAHNPTLSNDARKLTRDALDAMPDRSAWEIATHGFATDEPTAWALAGWVALERGWTAVRLDVEDGFLVLGLIDGVSI